MSDDSREGSAGELAEPSARPNQPGDGRNIDPTLGVLQGEGAQQVVPKERAGTEGAAPFAVWSGPDHGAPADRPSYYDRPILKEPVWKWYVPAYFYCGGMSGASAALGAVAQSIDRDGLDGLVAKSRWVAATAGAAGTVLLIVDLGRPERFLNMLRVFRPTSPMSVGSWVVAGEGPLSAISALLSRSRGLSRSVGDVSGRAAGALGSVMTGYTAVLLSNTAVPIWQQTRRTLPPLFVASAVSSAVAVLELLPLSESEAIAVRRLGLVGRVAEVAAALAFEKDAARVGRVAKPLHEGRAGMLWRAAKVLGVATLLASVAPHRSRPMRAVAGLLGTAGALALRFAVAEAGKQSAADPQATFEQQRAGLGAAETVPAG